MYRESRLRKSGRRHKEAVQSLDGVQTPAAVSPSGLPRDYPARPTPDAVCGYVGGLGPFYTRTTQEARAAAFDGDTTLSSRGGEGGSSSRTRPRRVRFAESVVFDERIEIKKKWVREGEVHSWHPLSSGSRRFYESVWICISIGALFLSTLLLMVSFVTNSWGIVTVPLLPPASVGQGTVLDQGHRIWHFGLWQCCRDDGLCLGLKWPAFYTATRTFAVLSLFAHALTFAWMLGHTLEKLLNYESCTMLTLIANCFIASSFSLIAVVCFGVIWPIEFSEMYPNTTNQLSYSYYLAVATVPLTSISGACALVDFKGAWKVYEIREQFGVEEEIVEEEDDEEESGEVGNDDEEEEGNEELQTAELRRLRRCTTV